MSLTDDLTLALGPVLTKYNSPGATLTIAGQPGTYVIAAPAPPVISPAPATPFEMGFNVGGTWASNSTINDTGFNLTQYLIDVAPFGAKYLRAWGNHSITGAVPMTDFTTTAAQAAAGQKVIYVWNLQQNQCKVPTQSAIVAHFNSWPTSAVSGVWAVELINEHDYTAYCTDTPANIAMLWMTAGPILKSKGYKVIASNALESFGMYTNATVKAALSTKYVDYIGRHAYESTAAASIADHIKVKAYAESLGLGYISTETGLKNANWAVEVPKLWAGLKALGGIYCCFTLYPWSTNQSEYANNPYEAPNKPNALYAPMKAVF